MGRLLLTSGQVSILLSVTIVFFFTLALFLSGWVLQQRYVHSLQAAIKPRLPKPLPAQKPIEPPTLDAKWARPMGSRPEVDDTYAQYVAGLTMDWSRLGYVQVVREHVELCSAVMLLSDLHRMKSPAKRILMFPKPWLAEAQDNQYSPEMTTTRRLLRTAARRYGVTLIPMKPIVEGTDGEALRNAPLLLPIAYHTLPSSYSLASLYSLVDYERLLYLEGPGVLLDASALDSLLAFSKSEPMAAYPATPERTDMSTSLLMIHPSQQSYSQLRALRASKPTSDLDMFRKTFTVPESLISEWSLSMGNVVYESQKLRTASDGFNATAFEQATTFVRLSDPELPGPEYDVPYAERARLRPRNEEAQEAWSRLYERFRQQRMEVCGLDLETYRPVTVSGEL
ncbi:glycosyltransferase family 8 protein [Curvularia clavata]|uniref:Glycosyltransferase family 8 protein n=1 Tax=Curvularia clavata TaxID=95742 RepID=A0A9Q8Z8C6_CURCL|nr:glycosyltransferase family 8 protein [Curvularia clavata]